MLDVNHSTSLLTPATDRDPASNAGFRKMFRKGKLTIGVLFAIESYPGDVPTMRNQIALAQLAERAGFAALGVRDVPLRDPSFGDVGQIFDPWVWLGYVAAQTTGIALFTAAMVLPLRHPLHTAKSAASLDQITGGRFVMGIASGDRAVEFPAFGVEHEQRGQLFREQVRYLDTVWGSAYPALDSGYGYLGGADVIPKPVARRVPLIVTGHSQQSVEWIAEHGDGWITYPRRLDLQAQLVKNWHDTVAEIDPAAFKPFSQPYHIDLDADPILRRCRSMAGTSWDERRCCATWSSSSSPA
ncbi:TIGR03571 family LLM class oxidoreductase [Cupriavidus sp. 2TAF22]|uniref:TIGR03571 family LLM class oxidoreductase n=1 Tax=unclassified Cupriavidus TaxID=2640874 RepID=UPI003F9217E7